MHGAGRPRPQRRHGEGPTAPTTGTTSRGHAGPPGCRRRADRAPDPDARTRRRCAEGPVGPGAGSFRGQRRPSRVCRRGRGAELQFRYASSRGIRWGEGAEGGLAGRLCAGAGRSIHCQQQVACIYFIFSRASGADRGAPTEWCSVRVFGTRARGLRRRAPNVQASAAGRARRAPVTCRSERSRGRARASARIKMPVRPAHPAAQVEAPGAPNAPARATATATSGSVPRRSPRGGRAV